MSIIDNGGSTRKGIGAKTETPGVGTRVVIPTAFGDEADFSPRDRQKGTILFIGRVTDPTAIATS
jgi:hypothetical protein